MAAVKPHVEALIAAAGAGRRFGGCKQLQELEGRSLVRRVVDAVQQAGLPAHVVIGAHAPALRSALADLPLRLVENPAWEDGLGASIACGVRAIMQEAPEADGLLVVLADQALLEASDLQALVRAFERDPRCIVASHLGRILGPPCVFPADLFGELATLAGDRGARSLLQAHRERVCPVAVPRAALDIDTPRDLERAQRT